MLPYLGAVALLVSTGLTTGTQVLALACHCFVMVAPPLLLVAGRVVATRLVEPLLVCLVDDRSSRRLRLSALVYECGPQASQAVADAGLDGAQQHPELLRHLAVRTPVEVREHDRLALQVGQTLQGSLHRPSLLSAFGLVTDSVIVAQVESRTTAVVA